MPKKICSNSKHVWVALRRGSKFEKCTTCGTMFPCRTNDCGHFDCMLVRGQEIPEYWRNLLGELGVEVDTTTLRLPGNKP